MSPARRPTQPKAARMAFYTLLLALICVALPFILKVPAKPASVVKDISAASADETIAEDALRNEIKKSEVDTSPFKIKTH